ncbi:exonuclease SbcCD subunit D [Luteolibacter algae]|uniref:Exonuclease SbcCD subunit D n=1 Tax=Luteolibacter algae TaxID=454151 RepID=A0ABW5D787_9BACT
MPVTFIHTADWQIGKPYARVSDPLKRGRLQHERIEALQRIKTAADAAKAAFILVAGDLFDSQTPDKATVSAACGAIGNMKIPVLVIPGNHDFGGPGSIWEQAFFLREKEQLAPNLHILLKPEPVILEQAILFPAPLLQRHTNSDSTAWIRAAFDEDGDRNFPENLPRIVLAHGSIQGFSAVSDDEEDSSASPNLIDISRLPLGEIDYIALGDWHGTKKIGEGKAWYSGTHEIDRFPRGERNQPGHVLAVTAGRGEAAGVEIIRTAGFQWQATDFHFSGDESLDRLKSELDDLIGTSGSEKLLLLTLRGSLGITAAAELEATLEALEARLLRLKLYNHTSIAPTEAEVRELAGRSADPLISHVARQLIEQSGSSSPEEAEIAILALRELFTATH